MMENSPFCSTFFSSYPAGNAVNVSDYRSQKYPLMLKPPHITPRGVSSLFLSLSQARMGNLRKLCRSHMEQEPRAELKSPCHSHTSTFPSFWSVPQKSALLPAELPVQGHRRLQAGTAAHYPSTSSHKDPNMPPSLPPPSPHLGHPALLQPQVPPGGDSPGLALPGDSSMSPPELFMPTELIPRCCQGRTKP